MNQPLSRAFPAPSKFQRKSPGNDVGDEPASQEVLLVSFATETVDTGQPDMPLGSNVFFLPFYLRENARCLDFKFSVLILSARYVNIRNCHTHKSLNHLVRHGRQISDSFHRVKPRARRIAGAFTLGMQRLAIAST